MRLTPSQLECVTFARHRPGGAEPMNLVIEAGAGAGKTAVLASRVLWKLTEAPRGERTEPHKLTVVTFTRAAQEEIHERILDLVEAKQPNLAPAITVATIDSLLQSLMELHFPSFWVHAFASETSTSASGTMRSPPPLQLIDENEALAFLERELGRLVDDIVTQAPPQERLALADFALAGGLGSAVYAAGQHNTNAGGRFTSINRMPFGSNTRSDLLKFLLSEACLLLAAPPLEFVQGLIHPGAVSLLQRLVPFARQCALGRLRQGRITHNDRLVFLHNLACAPESCRLNSPYANQSLHVSSSLNELIVDEYQDTSPAQHEILVTLARQQGARMIVVGDPKQSLYRFRSARVEVFQRLMASEDWHHIVLRENFRSHPDLLDHLNELASFALGFMDPKIPHSFWVGEHGAAALRCRVEPRNLEPGRSRSVDMSQTAPTPRVLVLSHSCHTERVGTEAAENLKAQGISYRDLSEDLLIDAIIHLKQCGDEASGTPARDPIAVLCETRNDCQRVVELLRRSGIPADLGHRSSASAQARDALPRQSARAAQALLLLLATWTRCFQGQTSLAPPSTLSLFDLFSSPLMGAHDRHPEEAAIRAHALHAAFAQHGAAHTTPTLAVQQLGALYPALAVGASPQAESLGACKQLLQLATEHFLAAWIILANGLTQATVADHSALAHAFKQEFALWCMAFSEHCDQADPNLWLPPELLAGFDSEPHSSQGAIASKTSAHPATQGSPTVVVQTVHGAKGLQWDRVVFLPKSFDSKGQATFRCLALGDRNVIQWLDGIGELEVLQRLPGPRDVALPWASDVTLEPNLRDLPEAGQRNLGPEGNPEDALAELAHQESAESGFERARVFYTAITRAKEHLVLLPGFGSGNQSKSLRDHLADLVDDEATSPAQDQERFDKLFPKLVPWTLARYLDRHFLLRSVRPKPGAKRGKQPVEPWTLTEEAILRSANSEGSSIQVRYIDRSAPTLRERVERTNERKKAIDELADNLEPRLPSPLRDNSPTQENRSWMELWSRGAEPRTIASKEPVAAEDSDDTLGRLERVRTGLLVHAAQEMIGSDPLELTQRDPEAYVLREFEIWLEQARSAGYRNSFTVAAPQRKVLDALVLVSLETFTQFFPKAPVHHLKCGSLVSKAAADSALPTERGYIAVVVDYKTGRPKPEHELQIQSYMSAVAQLVDSKGLEIKPRSGSSRSAQNQPSCVAGCLAYVGRHQDVVWVGVDS